MSQLRPSIYIFFLLSLVTGIVYPLTVTLIGQTFFSHQSEGSLILENGRIVGSELIGQQFTSDKYFWSRPSATSAFAYNTSSSSGSNLGPSNSSLVEAIQSRVQELSKLPANAHDKIPVDLVTSSGSGLDPHISPAAALWQIQRVAQARGVSSDRLQKFVLENTEERLLGIFGERRVNVLKINLALDKGELKP